MSKYNRQEEPSPTWPSWSRNPQTECLRVETSEQNFWVFPYTHFTSAKFEMNGGSDKITLEFSTHTIAVRGSSLRELALGFQKCSVEWIRPVPDPYAPVVKEGCLVQSIEIVPGGEAASAHRTAMQSENEL